MHQSCSTEKNESVGPYRKAEIRAATSADTEAVNHCAFETYSRYNERFGTEPAPHLVQLASAIDCGNVAVLTLGETLIGYVVYYPRADHMHLENVGVLPRFNGRGYGRRLIEHVEQAAIRNGLDAVELYTNEKMVENIAMYPKLGYTEVDRRIDKEFSRVFFRKTLNRGVEDTQRS